MPPRSGLTVRVRIEGVREILRALKELPPEAQDLLRTRSMRIAETLAVKIRSAALWDPQSALMAPTVKAKRDRVPVIQAGGKKRVGRNRTPADKILFGSEFGMNKRSGWYAASRFSDSFGRQYRPHVGAHSYWFFRTVDDDAPRISREWRSMSDDLIRRWGA